MYKIVYKLGNGLEYNVTAEELVNQIDNNKHNIAYILDENNNDVTYLKNVFK